MLNTVCLILERQYPSDRFLYTNSVCWAALKVGMRVKFTLLSGFGTAAAVLALVASLSTAAQVRQDEVSIPRINRGTNHPSRPNIVFILSDDQDVHLNSLDYMPHLKQHLLDQGTFFSRHYCTIALCCPSRVNLWTGRAGHNTNVTDVSPPYGGYPKFISQGLNDKWLPVWLQQSGYNTYYTGKLFNAHSVQNYNNPFPAGFNGSVSPLWIMCWRVYLRSRALKDFLLDPYTYQYLNATFQRNHDPPVSHTGEYSTDILAQKAYGFLDDAVTAGRPFFLGIAPVACHSNVILPLTATELPIFTAPIPAKRHEDLFPDAIVPRTESFNPDQVCKSYLFLQGLSYCPVYIAILLLPYSALLYVSSTNIKYAQIFLSKKVAPILTSDFSLLVPTG